MSYALKTNQGLQHPLAGLHTRGHLIIRSAGQDGLVAEYLPGPSSTRHGPQQLQVGAPLTRPPPIRPSLVRQVGLGLVEGGPPHVGAAEHALHLLLAPVPGRQLLQVQDHLLQ